MNAVQIDFGRRMLRPHLLGASIRVSVRAIVVAAALAVCTLAITIAALCLGTYTFSIGDVLAALIGEDGTARTVIVEWRAPRALAAVVFGAALAVSGAIFQSLTRNPLASPDLIGFSTGSFTGALVVMLVTGGGYAQVAGGAIAGGIATAAAVYALSFRRGMTGFRLIIVGIGVSAMLGAVNAWLMLTARNELALQAAFWGAGSLSSISGKQLPLSALLVAALLAGVSALAPSLRQLELGDESAIALGVRSRGVWLAAVVIGVALTAVVTAAAGPIGFVALAAPQISRRLTRTPGISLTASALLGALLLSAADIIAQHAFPLSIPVGIVTVVIGGAYLAWLLVREGRARRLHTL